MEASTSTHEQAPPVDAPADTAVQGGHGDRRLAMQAVGFVLAIYIAIGIAVYFLVTALL